MTMAQWSSPRGWLISSPTREPSTSCWRAGWCRRWRRGQNCPACIRPMKRTKNATRTGRRNADVPLTFPRLPAEHVVDCADDDARFLARKFVVDRLAIATSRHQAIGPQTRELLRHRRLAQAEQILEFADRFFSLGEYAENHQAAFVRKRLEKIAGT